MPILNKKVTAQFWKSTQFTETLPVVFAAHSGSRRLINPDLINGEIWLNAVPKNPAF
jgi:hypothetical protein